MWSKSTSDTTSSTVSNTTLPKWVGYPIFLLVSCWFWPRAADALSASIFSLTELRWCATMAKKNSFESRRRRSFFFITGLKASKFLVAWIAYWSTAHLTMTTPEDPREDSSSSKIEFWRITEPESGARDVLIVDDPELLYPHLTALADSNGSGECTNGEEVEEEGATARQARK